MPTYLYDAAAPDGSMTRGVIDAPTRSAAVERILALGRTPVRVVENGGAASATTSGAPAFLAGLGLATDRETLLQEFAILLRAGLGVERALVAMQGFTSRPRTKAAIQDLLDGLRAGEPLSQAMRRAGALFPDTLRRLVAAGEASGRLPEVMTRLAAVHARNRDIRDRMISAMIYPALLVVVMTGVLVMIFTVVIPQLEPLFDRSGTVLPWPAALLVGASRFFRDWGLMTALGLAALLAALLYGVRQPAGRLELHRRMLVSRLLLRLPLHYEAGQFCRNIAMLLDGGMPLNRALETAQEATGNLHLRQVLGGVLEQVRHGRTLRAALGDAAMFPGVALEFAAVGEETGRLGPMLNEAADILDRDVQLRLDRLSALLLPVVTAVLGIVVAAIMSGVVSGIMAANDLVL